MEENTSDHSPSGSLRRGEGDLHPGGSWLQCWENEINSISGLNLQGSSQELVELNSLVEDKEIAAKAVAFVVNSTRKGIVPLCADVANLLRTKRSLEKKVFKLKTENESLRSSASASVRTSHSTSPTPASLSSEKGSFNEHNSHLQERCRPCSRCSQTSSTISNSPQFNVKNNRQRLTSLQHSPASLQSNPDTRTRRHSSPKSRRSRSCNRTQGGITTEAVVHQPQKEVAEKPAVPPKRPDTLVAKTSVKEQRKNSLPEIVSEPNTDVKKVSPAVNTCGVSIPKINYCNPESCPVQEMLRYPPDIDPSPDRNSPSKDPEDHSLEAANSKLSEELGAARKEIELLKCRLRDLETKPVPEDCGGEFYIQNECERASLGWSVEDRVVWVNNNNSQNSKKSQHSLPRFGLQKIQPISPLFCEPLPGCKCCACDEAFGTDNVNEITQVTGKNLLENIRKFSVSHRLQVQMHDHVVAKGDRTGCIRYLGHLDGTGNANMLFVGLELDSPGGHHDGHFNGKRYFYCKINHGIFVPLQDIICKVNKKISRKVHMFEGSDKNTRRKNDSPEFSKLDDTDGDSVFS